MKKTTVVINPSSKRVTKGAARQRQIEAQRSEGGVHSKTMDDDEGSICRGHGEPFVTFLELGLILPGVFLAAHKEQNPDHEKSYPAPIGKRKAEKINHFIQTRDTRPA